MASVAIKSVGLYAPERVIENEYFNELYGKDVASFLRDKRNILKRHFMAEDQATSDLIVPAAKSAMEKAGLKAEDLDMVIIAGDTPDQLSPSTASVVQNKLGAKNAGTFDVNAACASFVTALDIAAKFVRIEPDRYRNILVCGAYGMSKYLNMDDYKIATLFADGAGAAIVGPTTNEKCGFLASEYFADGQYNDYMGIYAGGTMKPLSAAVLEEGSHQLDFRKKIPIETNVTQWPKLIHSLLDRTGFGLADVKHYFFTQINIDLINESLDRLKVDRSKAHNIMDQYGYTGSACIPMAMADADAKGKLKEGDLMMLVASGGGVSMAATAWIWGGGDA